MTLRRGDCALPPRGWGKLILTTACPRTGSAWTATGAPHEPRGLKHRPDGAIRLVPIPPALVTHLRRHLRDHGTAPDRRLFRGARGGILSESLYGRAWHAARAQALGPGLAASGLARRPYDLRHAALSLWLNATASPAEVAARAGNSAGVLQRVYAHCIDGHDQSASQQIEDALRPDSPVTDGDRRRSAAPPPDLRPVRQASATGPRTPACSAPGWSRALRNGHRRSRPGEHRCRPVPCYGDVRSSGEGSGWPGDLAHDWPTALA